MTLDRLCADMNVRTDKGKKKVRIVLKFLEMKRKVMRKGENVFIL